MLFVSPKIIVDESPIQQSQPINQQVLEEYNEFVKNNPTLLPKTELFDEINRLYPVINTSTNVDEKSIAEWLVKQSAKYRNKSFKSEQIHNDFEKVVSKM
jgi:hypothetical protein